MVLPGLVRLADKTKHTIPSGPLLLTKEFPSIERPPIQEVVFGFIFNPLPSFDMLDVGLYWRERRGDYPRKAIQPAIADAADPILLASTAMQRAWFITEQEDYLLQIQQNRFYMNWRHQGKLYPRFHGREGRQGLLKRAMKEFKDFEQFLKTHLNIDVLTLTRMELAKISVLRRGNHYNDRDDLCRLMKVASVFEDIHAKDPAGMRLHFTENNNGQQTLLTISMNEEMVRIEIRYISQTSTPTEELFTSANQRLNEVFFGLMSDQHLDRFEKDEE